MNLWQRVRWWWQRRNNPQVVVMGLVRLTLSSYEDDGDIATWGITPISSRRCVEQEFVRTRSMAEALLWVWLHYRHGRPCPLWIEDPRHPATR